MPRSINLTITANKPTTICAGDSILLSTNQPFSSYLWGRGDTTRSIWVKPTVTRGYVVTVTDQYRMYSRYLQKCYCKPKTKPQYSDQSGPTILRWGLCNPFCRDFPDGKVDLKIGWRLAVNGYSIDCGHR
ncbi:MAG: hypothetical protein R3B47_17315 [Bacteroidia bacterium]